MSAKTIVVIISLCLGLGIMVNYTRQIIETGQSQIEKAQMVVDQYNKHTEYLDNLLDETTAKNN